MTEKTIKQKVSLLHNRRILSPNRLALLMVFAVFICEIVDMTILSFMVPMSFLTEAVVDSLILVAFLVPIYFLLYRPFWKEYQRIESENIHLYRRLLKNAEEERKKVSHDLHDQCGQTLTGIQIGMETLRHSIPDSQSQAQNQLQNITQMITQLGIELREAILQLRPPLLEQMDINSALRGLVAKFSRHNPKVVIKEKYLQGDVLGKLSNDVEEALYRVCQESLNNIYRYANASEVSVKLEKQQRNVILMVQDNGVGIDKNTLRGEARNGKHHGVGIFGMRERVLALDGVFEILSEPGKGTTVSASIPVKV